MKENDPKLSHDEAATPPGLNMDTGGVHDTVDNGASDQGGPASEEVDSWEALMLEWLNNPPERTRPSLVLPRPPYFDRTILDRERFMARAKPKISKDILRQILRGESDVFRNCLVSADSGMFWVGSNSSMLNGTLADIQVPVPVDEPNWQPGRDKAGGGGSGQECGEDDSDIVYFPVSYEEFLELLELLFDLPWLKQTNADKMLTYSLKVRGTKRSGPMVRWNKKETAIARIERFHAAVNSRPEDYPGLTAESMPTVEEFPFKDVDLRFTRVEERWDPDSKAVVFFELDCSGSMADEPMAIAKFFFLITLLWLRTKYFGVTVVMIAHNHKAERIPDEADFFRVREDGGTQFGTGSAHELVCAIASAEFGGDDWSKYCLHATDGYGESAREVIPWIEMMIRQLGFSLFGYCEVTPANSWFGGFSWESSGLQAAKGVSDDVKQHVGIAKVSNMDEVPIGLMRIMTMAGLMDEGN